MKRTMGLCILIILTVIPATSFAEITQNDRLLQRPEWDGAVMEKYWVEGHLSYQAWEVDDLDLNVVSLGSTFIMPFPNLPDLELGGRLDAMYFDPDGFDDATGISDIDVWGKYQFLKYKYLKLSAGFLLTLPTGSDEILHPHASGEVNVEMFTAARYEVMKSLVIIGHFGLRRNGDIEKELNNRNLPKVDGELQVEIGSGAIYEVIPDLNLQVEINFATEAYENFDNDIQVRTGADYKLNQNFSLRGGIGIGLDEGAPKWELTTGCTFTF